MDELKEALKRAIEDIEWMSGAEDFSPGGKAEKGWKKVQLHIEEYNRIIGRDVED